MAISTLRREPLQPAAARQPNPSSQSESYRAVIVATIAVALVELVTIAFAWQVASSA